jgi:MFS family permease
MGDRDSICASAFLRSLSTGAVGVLLGIYLTRIGLPPAQVGLVIAAGLGGAAAATCLVMLLSHRIGRKRCLLAMAFLSGSGGLAVALLSQPVVLGAAAFVGMINGMGRDRGGSLVLEQAIIPATVPDASRTRAFAWYNVLQDAGHALGGLLAVLPALLRDAGVAGELASLRVTLGVCAFLCLATAPLYWGLSGFVEAAGGDARRRRVSPECRRILVKISSLFALDSLAGGFLTSAFLALYFHETFGVGVKTIGVLFLGARTLNALSHLGAAWLARRIGLVNTMVFTHIPSSIFLATAVLVPGFPAAAVLFLLREGLVEMDVPTRQSYVMAVVRPEERVTASAVTHLVRTAAWAVAPSFAGLISQGGSLSVPILIGAGMKIIYDVMLYAAFRRVRPPEETA